MNPKNVRRQIANGKITGQTSGMCPGFAQGNLVILPQAYAFDFLLFAQRNPKACPILEVIESGDILLKTAHGESVTKILPKYRLYRQGILIEELESIEHLWQEDFVTFIIGCSFTFESDLEASGIPLRHIAEGKNVAMYKTNLACQPAGAFRGNLVVSMRPIKSVDLLETIKICSQYPDVHGAPIHIGKAADIGIVDIHKPDFGEMVEIREDEIPVFWACGVTPQAVAMTVKPSLMITHSPGHMLITDIPNTELKR